MQRIATRLADLSAVLGGLVLAALIVMTCISIAGRAMAGLGLGPVPGDFELVESGVALAVFCFLPLCQMRAGHATVDLFSGAFGDRLNRLLLAFWEILAFLVLAIIAWRLWQGTLDKIGNRQTTLILQFPVWWAYAACLPPAAATVAVALWSAWDRLRGAATGRDTRPIAGEGSH